MTKQQIIDYVMETPQNTNPAILSQMLDEIAGEGGGSMEPLIVTGVQSELSSEVYFDKTFGEVWNAYKSGRPIILDLTNDYGVFCCTVQEMNYILNSERGEAKVSFTNNTYTAELNEAPYTEERLFALYPLAVYD